MSKEEILKDDEECEIEENDFDEELF